MRTLIAVVLGYAVWTALWLGGNTLLFAEIIESVGAGEHYAEAGELAKVIGLSVVCSLVAGFTAARLGKPKGKRAVLITAMLLLVTGIGVQVGSWESMPVWYHLTFLALLVPVVKIGGALGGAGREK